MPIELKARDRRALALGILVVGPLVLWRLVLAPGAAELKQSRERVQAERNLLERERTLLVAVPERVRQAEALVGALVSYSPRVFSSLNRVEAHVRQLAKASNVAVHEIERRTVDAPTSGTDSPIHEVGLRLTGESDLEGVLSLLDALRADEQLVTIERIDLSREGRTEPRAPEVLRLRLTLRAFISSSKLSEAAVP